MADIGAAYHGRPSAASIIRIRYETPVGPQGLRISGGEQQRVALAGALYGEPALVVLDEPDAHADTGAMNQLMRTVLALKQRGAAVVLVTHQMVSLRVVDRLLYLRAGEVVHAGPRDEVLTVLGSRRNVVPMAGRPQVADSSAKAAVEGPVSSGKGGVP